jgi:sulfite exporter TauE/SafE
MLLLHGGRAATYTALGALAGALGYTLSGAGLHRHGAGAHGLPLALPGLATWQGALALLGAVVTLYMALALLGRAPSPDLLLIRVTRWWGRTALSLRGASFAPQPRTRPPMPGIAAAHTPGLAMTFFLGLFWGLLPCGLVLAGLLLAAAAGSPWAGGLTMLAFALGTLPMGLGVGWTAGRVRLSPQWIARLRPLAATIILLFGAQMALRGLAAWGWVAHGRIGALPLW